MPTPTKKTRKRLPNHIEKEPADWERVGATLRLIRTMNGVTQDELATAIGFVRPSSISQIESGFKPLTDEKLIRAAEFLRVRPIAIRRPEFAPNEGNKA